MIFIYLNPVLYASSVLNDTEAILLQCCDEEKVAGVVLNQARLGHAW